ncbi:MAG: adenylyl-sulfate kinase [Myxococcota bacterium]
MRGGWVVWITGRPASGKTTLANAVARRLRGAHRPVVVLDGDEVRQALLPKLGYSDTDRQQAYELLARLGALLARQGLVVLVSATAHRRSYRARAKALAPRFTEVFVDVAEEECARRDVKGLYAKAKRGRAPRLPGVGVAYQAPLRPRVVARGGKDRAAIDGIVRALGG